MSTSGTGDGIETWRWFDDPRFELRFRYPPASPDGAPVRVSERALEHGIAANLRSDDGALYIKVARLEPVAPEEEYRRHAVALASRFGADAISKLGSTLLAGHPARTYAWRWPEGERVAIVLATAAATYRVTFDPTSRLTERVLATCELVER